MIKKIIMTILKMSKNIRTDVLDECISNDLLDEEQTYLILSRIDPHSIISNENIENKELVIKNCLIINCKIKDNRIENMTNNSMYNIYCSNSITEKIQ